jgi:hypothetical protein
VCEVHATAAEKMVERERERAGVPKVRVEDEGRVSTEQLLNERERERKRDTERERERERERQTETQVGPGFHSNS